MSSNQFASTSWDSQRMRGFGPFDPKSPEVQLVRCREKVQADFDKNVFECDKGNSMDFSKCSQKFQSDLSGGMGKCFTQYYQDTKDQPEFKHYAIIPTTVV
jgi:hypothetical protein